MNRHTLDASPRDSEQQRAVGTPGEQARSQRRGGMLALVAAAGLAVALIAILVFRVSPTTIAVAGFIALCPLLHLMGGHGHGAAAEPKTEDRLGRGQGGHGHQS